ncbi:hypothetical protein [Microbispora sp. NBRC 16548]|nr:hypothetical protein [Microbispora sp. NBRC 16548]
MEDRRRGPRSGRVTYPDAPGVHTLVDELKACGAEFARPQRMDDEV